jgi:hypothetical protein
MSDIDSLKQRIEHAELRLKTAHSARQRESAALTAMWEQIRDRFAAQGSEIVHLRNRVAALEDTRDQLQSLVHTLLGAVEGSIDRMADETVPRITGLAEDLLEADPSLGSETGTGPSPRRDDAAGQEKLSTVDTDGPKNGDSDTDFMAVLAEHLGDDETVPSPPPLPSEYGADAEPDEAVSPGIRSLISRIEGVFDGTNATRAPRPVAADAPDDEDAGLSQDLDDIKRLREELQDLRTRIGAGGR